MPHLSSAAADLSSAVSTASAPEPAALVAGLQVLAQAFLRVELHDTAAVAPPDRPLAHRR